jgi:hypothetical protein
MGRRTSSAPEGTTTCGPGCSSEMVIDSPLELHCEGQTLESVKPVVSKAPTLAKSSGAVHQRQRGKAGYFQVGNKTDEDDVFVGLFRTRSAEAKTCNERGKGFLSKQKVLV